MSKIEGLYEFIRENENPNFLLSDPENAHLVPHIRKLVSEHEKSIMKQEYNAAKKYAIAYKAENFDKIPKRPGRRKRIIVLNKYFDIFIFQSVTEAAEKIKVTKKTVLKVIEEKRTVKDYYIFHLD